MRGIPWRLSGVAVLLSALLFASCFAKKTPVPPASRITVESSRMAANDEFVEIRLQAPGGEPMDSDPAGAFLIDESTGERFYLMRLQRIGRMTEGRTTGGTQIQTILFKNREGKLRPGALVTLQFGSIIREHILLEK